MVPADSGGSGLTFAGRIRKSTQARVFLLEALAVSWSFTFAAFRPGQASWLDDPWVPLRIAIPTAAALAILLWRDATAWAEDPVQFASTLDVSMAYAAAFLTQPLLWKFGPALALAHWSPTEGGIVGPLFLMFVRALFPPPARRGAPEAEGAPMTVAEIRSRVEEFAGEIRVRNMAVCAVVAPLAGVAVRFELTGGSQARASFGIILAGIAYLVYQFLRRGLPRKAPSAGSFEQYAEFYRAELGRQLVFHLRAADWFYESLVPGFGVLIFGTRIYHFILVLVVLLIAEGNHRAGQRLERELAGALWLDAKIGRR
jgi:hypothetical protein